MEKLKSAYLEWNSFYQTLPKIHRHTLGQKIDVLFVEIMEAVAAASFLPREDKQPFVRLSIRKLDAMNVLLMILWEAKSLDTKKYAALAEKLSEIGKMLGGWQGQLAKLNPAKMRGEK